MTRVAAIDVGTNSVKLAIADVEGDVRIVREESEITRLGRGVDETRNLAREPMAATLNAVARFADDARAAGASRIVVAGTSALRDAGNGDEFLRSVRDRTGLDVEIISGMREAALAHLAVSSDPALQLDPSAELAVFDIGGGSTEVNIGSGESISYHRSFDVGAVRLTERFLRSDPPSASEMEEAKRYVSGEFEGVPAPAGARAAAGIGGTLVNVAAVTSKPGQAIHGSHLSMDRLREALSKLAGAPLERRRSMPGLEPGRADVIVGGVIILIALVERLGVESVQVSTRGLRYGLLKEMAR